MKGSRRKQYDNTKQEKNKITTIKANNVDNYTTRKPRKGADSHRRQVACTALVIFGSSKAPWPWPWLGSDEGHISIHSTCSATSKPKHLTVASRTTEIWPFECRQIWTFREVWTLVMAFLEGNSIIGLQQAVVQVPYYHCQPSVLSSTRKWQRR